MNKYTQHVVESAMENSYSATKIRADAASALTHYAFEKSGRLPYSVDRGTWNRAGRSVLRLIQDAWDDPEWRPHIRELAALLRLITALKNAGQNWSSVLVVVGDELDLSENWPELREVQRLFSVRQRSSFWSLVFEPRVNPNQIPDNPQWKSWKNPGVP